MKERENEIYIYIDELRETNEQASERVSERNSLNLKLKQIYISSIVGVSVRLCLYENKIVVDKTRENERDLSSMGN